MKPLRVLLVEDEFLIAIELEAIVIEIVENRLGQAEVVIAPSVAKAREALADPVDFVFLDVDVTDGKTFEIAERLNRERVPFAFVSASSPELLPLQLRKASFIPKPCRRHQIEHALRAVVQQPMPDP